MLPYFISFWLNGLNTDLRLKSERNRIACFDVDGHESLASKSSLWESNQFDKSKSEADF